MTIKILGRVVLLVGIAAAGLAGCSSDGGSGNGNGNGNGNGSGASALSDFVAMLIGTQTCDTAQPAEINGIELTSDEVPIDVDGLVPGDAGCPPT